MAGLGGESYELEGGHGWEAAPGHRVFVGGGGAVRFDVPADWVLKPDAESFKFYDAEPEKADTRLEVSWFGVTRACWAAFPVEPLVREIVADDYRPISSVGEVCALTRAGLRLAWVEFRFRDPAEDREACSRVLVAVGATAQCCITMDYWPENAGRVSPVWDTVMKTLGLGVRVIDAAAGVVVNPETN